jgi:hypothetical protein
LHAGQRGNIVALKHHTMKPVLTILLLIAALLMAQPMTASAQAANEEAAIRACLDNYTSFDGNRLEKAFHPSATMKYIDNKSGEFKDVPIADFIARSKSNTTKIDRKITIVSINIEGPAAQAKIKVETPEVFIYDYMNMLKINGEWKIVSKIFSRQPK